MSTIRLFSEPTCTSKQRALVALHTLTKMASVKRIVGMYGARFGRSASGVIFSSETELPIAGKSPYLI